MSSGSRLTMEQVIQVANLAKTRRQSLGFLEKAPIGNDLFTIYEGLNMILVEYPIPSEVDRPAFSAVLFYSEEGGESLVFVGLNTADYYDKQIFALAHELYHYFEKTSERGSHISRLEEAPDSVIEKQANLFAAEFLLPGDTLREMILKEFKTLSLDKTPFKTLLRFIARVHCSWWLPYRSIVRRLKEVQAITEQQYNELYAVKERETEGEYYRIGMAIDPVVFGRLNQQTNRIGTYGNELEIVIRNYEEGIIDEKHFIDTLALFSLTPDDFGYDLLKNQPGPKNWDDFNDEDEDDEH